MNLALKQKQVIAVGAILGFLSVAMGAFGAHALKEILSPESFAVYQTGSHYLSIHSLALLIYGVWLEHRSVQTWPAVCFILGCVFFSGSLFALALSGIKILGAITPIGGVLFLAGWFGFAYQAIRSSEPRINS